MFEAARFGDEIAHTSALTGFLLGALAGIALVAAVAFATFTCGLGAGLLWGLAASFGGSLLTSWGESKGRSKQSPAGTLNKGSPNVFINKLNAVFAINTPGNCSSHGSVMVAEGSTNVFINGLPASRKGDKLTCGAVISGGSPNVFIGGGTEAYLPIDDEIPALLRTTVDVLMAIAGAVGGLARIYMLGAGALKAIMPCALKFLAGFVVGEAVGRYVIEPVARRVMGGLMGNPVDVTTGRKLIPDETDFVLPGLMPIEWSRFYASNLTVDSVLGCGWVLPWEQTLRCSGHFIYLTDNQGRSIPFEALQPGQRCYNPHEQIFLLRSEGGHYLLQTLDNVVFYFGEVPADNVPVPLVRIENTLGHYLHFTRTPDGRLTDISAPGQQRVHLHYDHPLGRLTEVKRVVDNQAVETLVEYGYDENGQLARVRNRNGDKVREFTYTDGVMTRHANALGLSCEYRWAVIDGQPRVVEHFTSDGEHYHFTYDFAQRATRVTDVLGREAEFGYNEGHRVVASRDFGGETYGIALDDFGNLLGLTLPDGNVLTFKHDEFGRLLAETDPIGRTNTYAYHLHTTLVTKAQYADGSTWQAQYDGKGNLLSQSDALGHTTKYLHNDDGLPHTIIDATHKSKYLWWNNLAQMERYQDCSGKDTWYRFDDRQHLVAITNALGQTTELTRKPAGEVLSIQHPDGSTERFTYNPLGQVLSHVDGKGQRTVLERNARGLPSSRQDAKGQRVAYEYDKAIRLTALVNENNAAYQFAYDASDRLIEERRIDNLTRRFSYSQGGYLTRVEEIGYGERAEQPQRATEFERDSIGRLIARTNDDGRLEYAYDDSDRLASIERTPTNTGFRLGIQKEKLGFTYDLLGRLLTETTPQGELAYEYDPLSNLTTLTLPDGRQLNHLYYGSGHLHQLNLDGQVISDFERDDLHREAYRTQGKLTSCYGYDAMGRKAWQYASDKPAEKLSNITNPFVPREVLVGDQRNIIDRQYQYDPAGELTRTLDKLRGEIRYEYEANGQLHGRETGKLMTSEEFRYDAAANRLDFGTSQFDKVKDNRLRNWQNNQYLYDPWGNLIEKRSGQRQVQYFKYDCENRLVASETVVQGRLHSKGHYHYDSLGRRIGKRAEQDGQTQEKRFLWQGLRMLQELTPERDSLYLYEPGSYAPLARVDRAEGEAQQVYYYHTDQIGTPLEMTDVEGRIVWQATFKAWGSIQDLSVGEVEQNLRFQGQYFDDETGLHYNTFRYYDPEIGRFITQDPIGLDGGFNLYRYAPNPSGWIDPWGWECWSSARRKYWKAEATAPTRQYSPANLARMADGKAPRMTVEVMNRKTGDITVRDVSMELHHNDIPQRVGGDGVHDSANLLSLTPWEHEAVDSFRHVGSDLEGIVKGLDIW